MTKDARILKKRDSKKASLVEDTVEVMGVLKPVTKRTVYRTIDGENKNDAVFSTYMFLAEGRNQLLEAAKKLVPFD